MIRAAFVTNNVINVCRGERFLFDTSVGNTFDSVISKVSPGASVPVLVSQSFMSSDMARLIINRLRVRFAGKTKVVKLQGISDDELYEVASSEDGLKDRKVPGGEKSRKGKNYEMNVTTKRNRTWFTARTEVWKRTLTGGRRQEKANSNIAIICSVMSGGKNYQKWKNKTGKEIKSETVKSSLLEPFDEFPPLYTNEPSVNFDGHLSFEQSYDPALVVQDEPDRTSALTNHVTLNMSTANAWEETRIRPMTKVTVMNLFSRFKREKRAKVMRISI